MCLCASYLPIGRLHIVSLFPDEVMVVTGYRLGQQTGRGRRWPASESFCIIAAPLSQSHSNLYRPPLAGTGPLDDGQLQVFEFCAAVDVGVEALQTYRTIYAQIIENCFIPALLKEIHVPKINSAKRILDI